jgi:hypothetical protein
MKSHEELGGSMEEHCRAVEGLIAQAEQLQLRNARAIVAAVARLQPPRRELTKNYISFDAIKTLNDNLARVVKDFSYLKHPSQLPRAYEKSLIEVQRRKKFRKLVDEEAARLQTFIGREREQRLLFLNELGKILPSDFIP